MTHAEYFRATGIQFANTDKEVNTAFAVYDIGVKRQGAEEERERIAAHFHDHTAYTGMYIKEIIRNGQHNTRKGEEIPVRENAPQKENSVATKPSKGNTNDS